MRNTKLFAWCEEARQCLAVAVCRSECCRQLDAAISALELDHCWDWKPLLDGKEVGLV